MTDRTKRRSRREFLLAAGVGGAAAAAAIAGKASFREKPAKQDKRSTRGYHASEHVGNYYRTTKV